MDEDRADILEGTTVVSEQLEVYELRDFPSQPQSFMTKYIGEI